MSFAEFAGSISAPAATPPTGLSPALRALWHDGRGDWTAAHTEAQADASRAGSWVHAYLHRKEGDDANAGYWYARAGRRLPAEGVSLETEWAELVRTLLAER